MADRGKEHVVCVRRALLMDGSAQALVYARGGKYQARIHLSPEVHNALGEAMTGYFVAERIAGQWWIGEQLPDSPNRRW